MFLVFSVTETSRPFFQGLSSISCPITFSNDTKGLSVAYASHTCVALNVSSVTHWTLHQSVDFPLPSLLCGEVLLFWCRILSRAVSSFGYGAARQGIFSNVYFEVITRRCFCWSNGILIPSLIHCLVGCVLYCSSRWPSFSCDACVSLGASFLVVDVFSPWFSPCLPGISSSASLPRPCLSCLI